MPKIKIRNLDTEINRRIKLIKTSTSTAEIGLQDGAVSDQSDSVHICLSPFEQPNISCEGAGSSAVVAVTRIGQGHETEFYIEYEIDGNIYAQAQLNQLDIEVSGDEYYATLTNNSSENIRTSIKLIQGDEMEFVLDVYGNDAISQVNDGHYMLCLSPT